MIDVSRLFDKIVLMHGLKRSGNHAIIEWISLCTRIVVANNAFPIPIKRKLKGLEENQFPCTLSSKILGRHVLKRIVLGKKYFLISAEDHEIKNRILVEQELVNKNLLVIREPINLFSSRIRKAFTVPGGFAYPTQYNPLFQQAVLLWKEHCREAIDLTNHLDDKVIVYFDRWISDLAYQRRVYLDLGLDGQFVAPRDQISEVGRGSSFGDKTRITDNLLNRRSFLTPNQLELLSYVERDVELMELRSALIEKFVAI